MSGAAGPTLAVERMTVRYGRATALDDVSLAVATGSVYALLGRNGAGKSSLVRCLLGQQRPAAGRALLFGQDAWRRRRPLMARLGVLPEEPDAPPEMTARRLVAFCAALYPGWRGDDVAARLARFRVPLDVPFGRLSKGQKGELMLVLALGARPELLVLDDPTLGLDVVARRELYEELVGELADRGTTVFVTTHDLAGIEGIADRVGILRDGRLVVDEPIESLKARFRRVRLPAEDTVPQAWAPLSATREPWGSETIVARFGGDHPHGVEVAPLSLEEIFIAVAGSAEVAS